MIIELNRRAFSKLLDTTFNIHEFCDQLRHLVVNALARSEACIVQLLDLRSMCIGGAIDFPDGPLGELGGADFVGEIWVLPFRLHQRFRCIVFETVTPKITIFLLSTTTFLKVHTATISFPCAPQ